MRSLLPHALLLAAVLLSACGSDDDDDDPAARVAAACTDACVQIAAGCGVPPPTTDTCRGGCEIAGSLSPACAGGYEGYVACAGDRPAVSCDGASITVSAAATECIEPLTTYLLCAAESVATACIRVPLEDASCQAAGIGAQASVCASAPPGCSLFEGTLRADGVGVFCCP